MRYRHLAIIICLALLPTLFLNAQTTRYYVSPSGSDRSPGTEKKPWKTLEYAFGQIQKAEGDVTLTVMDGEYAPEATLALSGIKGRKVTVEAEQGATPRIMGEKRLSFKKLNGKSMLVADLKAAGVKEYGNPCKRENLVDLYWKGERQTLARYPNEGFIRAGQARGETFTWEHFGDEQEMELQELKNAKASSKVFFQKNWFMFDEEYSWVPEYLGVSAYYKNALQLDEFDDVFTMSPDEIYERVSQLSEGQKTSLMYRARHLIAENEVDSNRVIAALEEALGVKLSER